jgi:hypothetical protein
MSAAISTSPDGGLSVRPPGRLPPPGRSAFFVLRELAYTMTVDNPIVAWGANSFGQCEVPVPNSGFIAVAAGDCHSLGVKTDGSIVARGRNDYHQCNVPPPNTGFVAVAAGEIHSIALENGGGTSAVESGAPSTPPPVVHIWPNPSSGLCRIPFHLTTSDPVTAQVLDPSGRVVR